MTPKSLKQGADHLRQVAKQVPFGLSRGLNDVVLRVQREQKLGMSSTFTIRRPAFLNRSVRVQLAKKFDLRASVSIVSPEFAQHETPSLKVPRSGEHVASPVAVRRTKRQIVVKSEQPRAVLNQRKVFKLPTKRSDVELVVRQVGRGKQTSLQTLWVLRPSVPIGIRARLGFLDRARDITGRHGVQAIRDGIAYAFRTAKP
jgi:hypothetical protein